MTTFEARTTDAAKPDPTPYLGRLSLRDYRNFEELDCELPEVGVAIIGPNGSGKTNLLEAIYYLEVFRSFRNSRDSSLIRFGQPAFRVAGHMSGGRAGEDGSGAISAAFDRRGGRKKVMRDRRELDRVSAGIGGLGVALFRLEDLGIIRDSPGDRRRYLNVVLSLAEPGYLTALQKYRHILGQRNEALKRGGRPAEVEAWTAGLISEGATLSRARAKWVIDGAEAFARYYDAVSGGEVASVSYASSYSKQGGEGDAGEGRHEGERAVDLDEWKARAERAFAVTADRERRRGMTVVGPHRDDLRFSRRGQSGMRDLRSFGSSGQQRTAALALRLVEADRTRERLGREPLYLLDDVFAELDDERSRRLLSLLEEGRSGQVILTAPKAGDLELRAGSLPRWGIRNGRLLA